MTDRRTGGVGANADLKRTGITVNRQTGGVGANVDLLRTGITLNRQIGGVGAMVDLAPAAGPTTYPITGSTTVAQSVNFDLVFQSGVVQVILRASQPTTVSLPRAVTLTRSVSQTQSASLTRAVTRVLTRAVTQSQALSIGLLRVLVRTVATTQGAALRIGAAPNITRATTQATAASVRRLVGLPRGVSQSTSVALRTSVRLTRLATQAQSVSRTITRGYQRTVSTTQGHAVRLLKAIGLIRVMTGSHRVSTRVSRAYSLGRATRATQPTVARLGRRIILTRAVTQAQSVSLGGLPVQLIVVSAVQTRSLELGRTVSLLRDVVVRQATLLVRDLVAVRTLHQPTQLARVQDVSLTRALEQGTAVSLGVRNVTPFYQVLVSTTVGQLVALSSVGTGATARVFVVHTRDSSFVIPGRAGRFVTGRRGVRFIVEDRQ